MNRAIIFVLDSFGVGEAPDAKDYGDEGSNTFVHIYEQTKIHLENMKQMWIRSMAQIQLISSSITLRLEIRTTRLQ